MLSDVTSRKAKPALKLFKLFDERGMYLLVTPAGGKLWRLKYRFDRKEKLLALGAYPAVCLAEARNRRLMVGFSSAVTPKRGTILPPRSPVMAGPIPTLRPGSTAVLLLRIS